ncbi:vitamin B12 dependent-methionine synthase activation domain-containing protein [candidate division KSB1 bacterium]
MSFIHEFNNSEVMPYRRDVLRNQGMPDGVNIPEKISDILSEALNILNEKIKPVCLYSGITEKEFVPIFEGEGRNANDAVLKSIFPKSDHLAVFVLTLGIEISELISDLFESSDFALASMLDAAASKAADNAVTVTEELYYSSLYNDSTGSKNKAVLSYSPGYCGWDITAQKKLFEFLDPGKIGITLNESYLMIPLKSVSGLLAAGDKEMHVFTNDYSYCGDCNNQSCVERIKNLIKC